MDYRALKGLVETVVANYTCPACNAKISESGVDVIGAAGNTVNIDITCDSCGAHSMVKSEVHTLDVNQLGSKANIIKKSLQETPKQTENPIKDESIIELNSKLRKGKINASDFFKEDGK